MLSRVGGVYRAVVIIKHSYDCVSSLLWVIEYRMAKPIVRLPTARFLDTTRPRPGTAIEVQRRVEIMV